MLYVGRIFTGISGPVCTCLHPKFVVKFSVSSSTTEVVSQPPDCSECDVCTLDLFTINPLSQFATPAHCHTMVRTSESVTPQDRSPDFDSSVTELKSVVDPTGSRSKQTIDVELPEHLNVLFCQTVEGADLSRDTIKELKTLRRRQLI